MPDEKRPAGGDTFSDEPVWDRLLLYVRALHLPPQEGLRLVLQTMETAAESGISGNLSEILDLLKINIENAGFDPGRADKLLSVPHYNRGTMLPAHLRSASVFGLTHIGRLFLPSRKRGDRR